MGCSMQKTIKNVFFRTFSSTQKTKNASPGAKIGSRTYGPPLSSRSMYFTSTLCIEKCLLESSGTFWYNLEDQTIRRNDYMAGESNFCRF